eukprot:TRINITY_DN37207_c0_g1_i1.p1 TRINITY_DN37207_c0_g1~~TRINITY_DN37207_c0_g1_i1.p1  ORF type:complete len:571 (-),score=75.84 TRINITY_DN37207_c0_g1_i1:138-1850(-)
MAASEPEGHGNPQVGAALLLAMVFLMLLKYITNAGDPDIRRYSSEIIHSTIGIFCAVLFFSSINELIEHYVFEGFEIHEQTQVILLLLFAAAWFGLLQLGLAVSSNLFVSEERYRMYWATPAGKRCTKLNLHTSCLFLAHVTGFATIQAWATLQQLEWFKQDALHASLSIPMSILFVFVLSSGWGAVRHCITAWDDHLDSRENFWLEHVQEAETDVTSLSVSFLVVQVIRFGISGELPDSEGNDPAGQSSTSNVLVLFLFGFIFALAAVALLTGLCRCQRLRSNPEAGSLHSDGGLLEADEGRRSSFTRAASFQSIQVSFRAWCSRESFHSVLERTRETLIMCLALSFAWSFFFAGEGWMMDLTHVKSKDPTLSAVYLAGALSIASFVCIWCMDKIYDMRTAGEGNDRVAKGLVQLIQAFGILVGIAWERSFDEAVLAVASATSDPVLTKSLLAICSVLVVAPAWRMYIAPMVVLGGWRFGLDPHHICNRMRAITDRGESPQALEFADEYCKFLHELQCVHHGGPNLEEPHMDSTTAVFKLGLSHAWSQAGSLTTSRRELHSISASNERS